MYLHYLVFFKLVNHFYSSVQRISSQVKVVRFQQIPFLKRFFILQKTFNFFLQIRLHFPQTLFHPVLHLFPSHFSFYCVRKKQNSLKLIFYPRIILASLPPSSFLKQSLPNQLSVTHCYQWSCLTQGHFSHKKVVNDIPVD